MTPKTTLEPGDVVQLSPDSCKLRSLAGCMMVVVSSDAAGARGYVQGIGLHNAPGHPIYYFASWHEMEIVGQAMWSNTDPERVIGQINASQRHSGNGTQPPVDQL